MTPTAKHAGGRPTEYKSEYVDLLKKYLEEAVPLNMKIPSVEGFALLLDVGKKTLYRWGKQNKEFRHALGRLKMTQKEHLVETGIFGGKEINANIIALMLKVNHKMIETTKADFTTKGEKIETNSIAFIDFNASKSK
jgi:hypothetical protein